MYCVEECVVCGLVFCKSLICCVKIVKTCPALLEYHHCTIVKVYVYERVQSSVDGDPELGRHCGKGGYVCKGLFVIKNFKN